MKLTNKFIFLVILISVIALISTTAAASELRVMAAASLTEPVHEIKLKFEAENPGTKVEVNFAGSQNLYSQLKLGVEADIFLSANYRYIKELQDINIIGDDDIFARNEVIAIFNEETEKAATLAELFKKDYSYIVADKSVPIGSYTVKVINNYLESIEDQEKRALLRKKYENSILSKEFDVKSVVNKIKLGSADVGFVYLSDYQNEKELKVMKIPAEYNTTAEYYQALTLRSKDKELANKFYNYMLSDKAVDILNDYNFKAGEN